MPAIDAIRYRGPGPLLHPGKDARRARQPEKHRSRRTAVDILVPKYYNRKGFCSSSSANYLRGPTRGSRIYSPVGAGHACD